MRTVFPAVGWGAPAWAFWVDVGLRLGLVALLVVGAGLVWLLLLCVFWFLVFGCWVSVSGVAFVSRFLLGLLSFWSCSGKNSLNVIGVSW